MNAFSGEVHPVADLFPMLADDELAELAEDIKARGLLQPIVLDVEGRLLDGRNRLSACDLAGVTPSFTTFDGDDPDGYALAVNITRRHLSKGQQAVVIVRAGQLFNLNSQSELARRTQIPQARFSQAKTVLDHAPDLASRVVDGTMPLNDAYQVARQRKLDAEEARSKLDRLRDDAPDLLSLVDDERMSLDDAIAALDAREEKARQEAAQLRTAEQEQERKRAEDQRDSLALLNRALDLVAPDYMTGDFVESWAARIAGAADNDLIKRTQRAGQVLLDLAERIDR